MSLAPAFESTDPLNVDPGPAVPSALSLSPAAVTGARKKNLLKDIPGLPPPLPVPQAKIASLETASLNTNDIQGDILVGMHKQKQLFYFFAINDVSAFKTHLAADVAPVVASVTQVSNINTQPLVAFNIAFSHSGLVALGVTDDLGDAIFRDGQAADAANSFNESTASWIPQFVGTGIHGVILLASDATGLVDQQVSSIESTFGYSISKVYSVSASIRPGAEAGHETFGFLDGIAQPAIKGLNTPLPGQNIVDAGVIITGAANGESSHDSTFFGGSFLAFRQLEQRVPEFNQYLVDHAPAGAGSLESRAELLGARMVGRWKSGAPIDLAPTADDPALGADPQRNNNFTFAHAGSDLSTDQSRCPFSAHIRKTRPRADLGGSLTPPNLSAPTNSIMRSGLPYGPEVTREEAESGTTIYERGRAFVAYQAQLANGFHFLQQSWADNETFPPRKTPSQVGFDPIIGQAPGGQDRVVAGLDPNDSTATLSIPQFVISHGGEYFFSPPISALGGRLAE
ncbi:DyP-type peroxidase [Auricularia subglabra TFB-10046 SS5]|uniref:DyP-type peroxidase n=1 Tax=Auricularia subglabra (strain TFB-10046 / SS5) TaxID=717982 RepID=J0WT45_AURST|nr:DyP-type peroxidase [Auricularia subglabra TFB-10046 SS5]